MAIEFALPERRRRRQIFLRRPDSGKGQLVFGRAGQQRVAYRIQDEQARTHRSRNLGAFFVKSAPIATVKPADREITRNVGGAIRVFRPNVLVVAGGLFESLHFKKKIGAAESRGAVIRRNLERPVETDQGLGKPPLLLKRSTAPKPRFRIFGLKRKVGFIAGRRLQGSVELQQ